MEIDEKEYNEKKVREKKIKRSDDVLVIPRDAHTNEVWWESS